MASKEEDIAFYIDQQGPRKGSMSGNDKIFAARKRMQEAGKEREKKARCRSDKDAGQSLQHAVGADPDDLDDKEVEASDNGDYEMQDPRDPRDRHRKEEEVVTVNIPRHILSASAVQEVADRFFMSNNQVFPINTKCTSSSPCCLFL